MAGFAWGCGALGRSPEGLSRRDYDAGPPRRRPATGPPGSPPDGARTGGQRRANVWISSSPSTTSNPARTSLTHRWLSLRGLRGAGLQDLPRGWSDFVPARAGARTRDGPRFECRGCEHGRRSAQSETARWFSVGSGSWRSGLPSRLSCFSERSELRLRWSAPGGRTRRRLVIPTRCCTRGGTRGARPYAATRAARPAARAQDILARIVSGARRAPGPGHGYSPLPSPPPAVPAPGAASP